MHLPSQNQPNVKILCLLTKMKKNINLYKDKVLRKAWKSSHIGFWVCLITMQYVRTLCDKYFFELWWFFWTPSYKKWKKNINLYREKVVWKGLNICTYRFLCMLISMHYVRTLCDKYVLSYDGFFLDFWQEGLGIGFRNMVYWVEWNPRRTAA